MAVSIQLKRALAATWVSLHPYVLLDGERGLEKDTRKTKMGDGVTEWQDLPYEGAATTTGKQWVKILLADYLELTTLQQEDPDIVYDVR